MRTLLVALLLLWTVPGYTAEPKTARINWEPWSDGAFERAARENRFVLLDLEAVWCHWCHVMDEVTYSDPKVVELIKSRYIAVRVDQDSRPDISRRYEDYGWPATVVFNAEGREIVKRRGYLAPPVMISMLQEIIVDPSPVDYGDDEPVAKFADNALLSPKVRQSLERAFYDTHDPKLGGLKQFQKFIDHDTVEYGLLRAAQGDSQAETITRRTLTAALKLVDPAWGGVYQYSTDSDWDHPHYEKIMAMQAEPLRLYALAYGQFGDARYLQAVRDIHRYATTFLRSPEGAFYTSQDADLVKGEHSEKYFALDDAARRKLGVPVVDKHRYARENGWMIHALATAYTATGDHTYLDDAQRAARWIIANRSLSGGGFRHDERDVAGPYLEDTLAMSEAFLALYTVTGAREWLAHAESGAAFIEQHFRGSQPGYVTSAPRAGSRLQPKSNIDENIPLARFANLLHRYTGNARYRTMSDYALRMLVTEQIANSQLTAPGILLAAFESANDPLHITIVGGKGDAEAETLFESAIRYAAVYRRIEWWDRREGNMPNPDVRYPQLPRAAAFICTDSTCSLPIFDAAKVTTEIQRSVRKVAKT
ncbi:MAG TPA: DUF255 domain-containing protein [Steroidobacteraceae bacterium]|jgi:hypothetical protein|nr:DUF255 domain-containing protein [Steroidobacteraceae bacterium]